MWDFSPVLCVDVIGAQSSPLHRLLLPWSQSAGIHSHRHLLTHISHTQTAHGQIHTLAALQSDNCTCGLNRVLHSPFWQLPHPFWPFLTTFSSSFKKSDFLSPRCPQGRKALPLVVEVTVLGDFRTSCSLLHQHPHSGKAVCEGSPSACRCLLCARTIELSAAAQRTDWTDRTPTARVWGQKESFALWQWWPAAWANCLCRTCLPLVTTAWELAWSIGRWEGDS